MKNQKLYSLHKHRIKNFPRSKIRCNYPDEIHGADLDDLTRLRKNNDGYKFILTLVDCFTRYAWAWPLKNKSAETVLTALKKIYNTSGRLPTYLRADAGKEFKGPVAEYLEEKKVNFILAKGSKKAALVEMFNRTLKTRLFKHFSYNRNRWVDALSDVVNTYNAQTHQSTGFAPKDVTFAQQAELVDEQRLTTAQPMPKPKFSIGDLVRILEPSDIFTKGYVQTYSKDIFTVEQVLYDTVITYRLAGLSENFHAQELVLAGEDGKVF